jgi:hypothetical protein
MINQGIPLVGAGTLLGDDAYGLGTLADVLPHFIIYPLCGQTTLIQQNPNAPCCTLADSHTGNFGAEEDV